MPAYTSTLVTVDLSEVIDNDLEGFLDLLAERSGHPLLMDITYTLVSASDGALYLTVSGDTSAEDGEDNR